MPTDILRCCGAHEESTLLGVTEISVAVVDGRQTFAEAIGEQLAAEAGLQVVATAEFLAAAAACGAVRRKDLALLRRGG
jgi:hypothetical protein